MAESAKKAIDVRYRPLDYIYTPFWRPSLDGTPLVSPMFFTYPEDRSQRGWSSSTSTDRVYFPDDVFYDWYTHDTIDSSGEYREIESPIKHIPLFIRGGQIIPLRVKSGMTTREVREKDFELIVALGRDRTAEGRLYLDDGESLEQERTSDMRVEFQNGTLSVTGTFEYDTPTRLKAVTVLGLDAGRDGAGTGGNRTGAKIEIDEPLHRTGGFEVDIRGR